MTLAGAAAPRQPKPSHSVGAWLASFLVVFALAGLWALASPLFSGPDEPAQVLRSVSLVEGTLLGHAIGGPSSPTTKVRVPGWLAGANAAPACFRGRPQTSARCEPTVPTTRGTVVESTYTGRYPPLYYAVVGWPSLITSGRLALYLMRMASSAVSAVFLAGALGCARHSRQARGLTLGVAVVATPQVFFLAGVINPSGLEVSAALCLWTAAVVAVEGPATEAGRVPASVLAWLGISGAVMANVRALSPLWVLIIGLSVGLYAGRRRVLALLSDRRFQIALAVIVGFGALAVIWIFAAGALRVKPTKNASHSVGPWLGLGLTLENIGSETVQMVGVFGWVDTYLPTLCYVVWLGLAAAVAALGTARASRRQRLVLIGFALACVVVPAALALSQRGAVGIFGQARDWMPMWVGLPILAGHSLGWRGRPAARAGLLVCLETLQAFAWAWALRRYRSGSGHVALSSPAAWSPPLPAPLLLAGVVICAAGLALACWGPAIPRIASGDTQQT